MHIRRKADIVLSKYILFNSPAREGCFVTFLLIIIEKLRVQRVLLCYISENFIASLTRATSPLDERNFRVSSRDRRRCVDSLQVRNKQSSHK